MQTLVGVALPSRSSSRDAERQVERLEADPGQLVRQLRYGGFMRHRCVRIGRARPRLERVLAARAVDVKQPFRLGIIGLERLIADRPGWRDAAGMNHLAKVALAHPEQRRAIDLGVAADIVMQRRAEAVAVRVCPRLVGLVGAVDEHRLRVPVLFLARQIVAAFEDQDALAGRRQPLRQRGAAGAAADHDQVIMAIVHWQTSESIRRTADPTTLFPRPRMSRRSSWCRRTRRGIATYMKGIARDIEWSILPTVAQ